MSDDGPISTTPQEDSESALNEAAASLVKELKSKTYSERELFTSLHHEIRRIARAKMRRERADHTLQPTALVNEAFLKIYKSSIPSNFWEDPSQALRLIAHAMEQILNDYADAHFARKRGGDQNRRVPLDENQAHEFAKGEEDLRLDSALFIRPGQSEEILSVRGAISLLRKVAPRQAEVLQLQFYCGLTQDEIANLLQLSPDTVKLDTRKAKAFLKTRLINLSKV